MFGSITNSLFYKFQSNIYCYQIFSKQKYTNEHLSFIEKQNSRWMNFEKRKTSKLLEFLRPHYIIVGRGNSKVSSSWHTLWYIDNWGRNWYWRGWNKVPLPFLSPSYNFFFFLPICLCLFSDELSYIPFHRKSPPPPPSPPRIEWRLPNNHEW